MGYRLGIQDTKGNMFYGTKHYGYLGDNQSNQPSFRYLGLLGKVTNPQLPGGYNNICHETVLRIDELKTFIKLYEKEMGCHYITTHEDYKKIIKENEDGQYVIVDWS